MIDPESVPIPEALRGFLAASAGVDPSEVLALAGGARHRVLRVGDATRRVVVKLHGPPRAGFDDSFAREWRMHRFIEAQAGGRVPALVAADAGLRCLVFEWIDADVDLPRPPLDARLLGAMAEFVARINRPGLREVARAEGLPMASEGGLRLADHLACARRRIDRLLRTGGPDHAAMHRFVRDQLMPAWQAEAARIAERDEAIHDPAVEPIVSPSDFGRHNLLETRDGAVRFIDFEHAGWDDPAKLVADLILQPEHPLDSRQAAAFIEPLLATGCVMPGLVARTRRLLGVQRLKWVAIVLNPFLAPEEAGPAAGARLDACLAKARAQFALEPPTLDG